MSGVEELRAAREAMDRYRRQASCVTCEDDALAVIDMLDKDIEFETLMHQYVAAGMSHPKAVEVTQRSRQIGEARDEVKRRMGIAPLRQPGAAAGIVRTWREDLGSMVPRPLGLLSNPKRSR